MWMGNFHHYIVSVLSVDRRLRGEARFDRRLCLDDAFGIAVHAPNIFGDMHAYGKEGVRFYTKQKSVMQRWPESIAKGAEFVMPTSK